MFNIQSPYFTGSKYPSLQALSIAHIRVPPTYLWFLQQHQPINKSSLCWSLFLLNLFLFRVENYHCPHKLEWCVTLSLPPPLSLSAQSLRGQLPFQNDPWPSIEHYHSFFIFFQNNKNSLTNKDFFILSRFDLYLQLKMRQTPSRVHFISSWLRSHPGAPSLPPAGLTREYQGLLLCLWRGIQAIQWSVTHNSKQTSPTFATTPGLFIYGQ